MCCILQGRCDLYFPCTVALLSFGRGPGTDPNSTAGKAYIPVFGLLPTALLNILTGPTAAASQPSDQLLVAPEHYRLPQNAAQHNV